MLVCDEAHEKTSLRSIKINELIKLMYYSQIEVGSTVISNNSLCDLCDD